MTKLQSRRHPAADLPCYASTLTVSVVPRTASCETDDMRLLVVEDEPKLASFIQKGLGEESFAVDVARDGEEALDRVRRTAYDLIILDVMLSRMDGFAVCRELRAREQEMPVLMLSARGLIEDRVKGLDTGADDYLTKPFSFDELRARVRALLT